MRKSKSCQRRPGALVTAGLAVGFCASSARALTISLVADPGMSAQAVAGFRAAADQWQANFTDNVTVTINIGFQPLSPGVLGQTGSSYAGYSYSDVRAALGANRTSSDDFLSHGAMPASPLPMLINYTSNNPNGSGSPIPYLDTAGNNNTTVQMPTANARALGLPVAAGADANITFSSTFSFDFDQTNGIDGGSYDFIGVAAHEIGHALGFASGVDVLDYNSNGTYFPDDAFTFVSTEDLFRFSTESRAQGVGVVDWCADSRDKYFSIDGGTTKLASFAQGVTHGDGGQASHWKDGQGIGVMDPTASPGELLKITEFDRRFFDVIGWDRSHSWKWLVATNGTWTDPVRWDAQGVPDQRIDAVFPAAGGYTVTVPGAVKARNLIVTGGSPLLSASSVQMLSLSAGITVDGGTLRLNNVNVIADGVMNVAAGTVVMTNSTLKVGLLTMNGSPSAPTGKIDIGSKGLIVDYDGGIGTQLSTITSQIGAGRGTFNTTLQIYSYNGNGITSSLALPANLSAHFDRFAIGAINNADLVAFNGTGYSSFLGLSVDTTSILVRYTYSGDANLDGKIDSLDYSLINRAFAGIIANVGWLSGDFNLDGLINASDYAVIDFGYLKQGVPLGSEEPTTVPEPGAAILAGATALVILRGRRRRIRVC